MVVMTDEGHFRNGWFYPNPKKNPISLDTVEARVCDLERLIRGSLTHHIDVHLKSPSLVVLVGEVAGKDYVKIAEIPPYMSREFAEMLKICQRYSARGRIDQPFGLPRF